MESTYCRTNPIAIEAILCVSRQMVSISSYVILYIGRSTQLTVRIMMMMSNNTTNNVVVMIIRFVLCLRSGAFISFLYFSKFFFVFFFRLVWPISIHWQNSKRTEQLPSNTIQFILVESYLYDLYTLIFNRFTVPFLSCKNRIACIASQPA